MWRSEIVSLRGEKLRDVAQHIIGNTPVKLFSGAQQQKCS